MPRVARLVPLALVACGEAVLVGGDESSTSGADGTAFTATVAASVSSTSVGETSAGPGSTTGASDETTSASDVTSDGPTSESASETGPPPVCGDGVAEAPEPCDGDDLAGSDCITLGFASGDLVCTRDCELDTSACEACGNGVVDAGEACDGAVFGGVTCPSLGMGFTGGLLGCGASCTIDGSMCTSFPLPGKYELVFTEIMGESITVPDPEGQWFEIHNPSPVATYQLQGCFLQLGWDDDPIPIDFDAPVGPGQDVTFAAPSADGPGFAPDFTWSGLNIEEGEEIGLVCDDGSVDHVWWGQPEAFAVPGTTPGIARSLDEDCTDAVDNDDYMCWCNAAQSYNGDLGTPGTANGQCVFGWPIAACYLPPPLVIEEAEGTILTIRGRVLVAGLTDQTVFNDADPLMLYPWFGLGPAGTDPMTDPAWSWTWAELDAGWDGSLAMPPEPDYDQYVVDGIIVPSPGTYDFAFRFSGDASWEETYTYCDGGPLGSLDGYSSLDAGKITSTPSGPQSALLLTEYVEGSTFGNRAIEIFNTSTTGVVLEGCSLDTYADGAALPTSTIGFGGTLKSGETLVLCHGGIADVSGCDWFPGLTFGGDDAVALACGGVNIDVIGQIGFDPGTSWSANGVATTDQTLRRACDVIAGDADGTDAFDPSVEWTTHPVDDLTDLDLRTCP